MSKRKTIFFSLAILLLVFEVILRWNHIQNHNLLALKYKGQDLCFRSDRDLVYTAIPGRCGTNSQGYFDDEHAFLKPEGVFRIVIIGDSVAEGYAINFQESFGKVLERKLHGFYDKEIEVIILASSGYSTGQELIVFEKEAFRYDPDLIIWSYVMNDPAHPVFHDANGERGAYFYQPKIYLLSYLSKKIFYVKEKLAARRLRCGPEFHRFLHCVYWREVASNIEKIGKVAHSMNTPVIFLILPIFENDTTFDGYSLMDLHERLSQTAAQSGLVPLDLLRPFRDYAPAELKQGPKEWYDPWHLNEKGHEVTAEYLFETIVGQKYIDDYSSTTQSGPAGEKVK